MKDMSAPNVSLIVCTVDRLESLDRLLESLKGQTSIRFEIIIVDQNPSGYIDILLKKYFGLNIIHLGDLGGLRGLSRARNHGLSFARGEIVGFPDDDCWYGSSVVEEVLRRFEKDDVDLLVGKTIDHNGIESVSPHLVERSKITRDNVFKSGNSNGLFVRRNLAVDVQGFDESLGVGSGTSFQSGEETDFMLRCLVAGAACIFDPTLLVYHDRIEDDQIGKIRRIQRYSPGYGRVLRLHQYGLSRLGGDVMRSALSGMLCLVRGRRNEGRERLLWAVGATSGFLARTSTDKSSVTSRTL